MGRQVGVLAFQLVFVINASRSWAITEAKFIGFEAPVVTGVSANGLIVTGISRDGLFLWSASSGYEIVSLPSGYSLRSVEDISGDGTTIVGEMQVYPSPSPLDSYREPFRWSRSLGFQLLGRLSSDRSDPARATAVSHDGSVVVGTSETSDGRRAFRWTASDGLVNLGTLRTHAFPFSEAEGISADGNVVVGYVSTPDDEYYKAYRWTPADGFEVVGIPPARIPNGTPAGGAEAISGDGRLVIGFSQVNDFESWTWNPENPFVIVPPLPGNTTARVFASSFDGSTLVGRQTTWNDPVPGKVTHDAIIWRSSPSGYKPHRVVDILGDFGLETAGLHLSYALDVSYDGSVVIGIGHDAEGLQRTWYASIPIPEPDTASLMLMVCAVRFVVPRSPS